MADFEYIVNADGTVSKRDFTPDEIAARDLWERKSKVPGEVTAKQVRLLLLNKGLLDGVEAMIKTQSREVQIAWEWSERFERTNPLLSSLAANLGLTDAQIDDFFIEASAL